MNDQTLLVMFPIVGLSVLAGLAGIYFLWRERREDRDKPPVQKN
jgi:hypothetical protein